MTQPEAPSHDPEKEQLPDPSVEPETQGELETEPEPPPWTPERVLEWNAYYDLYVMLAALLLAFIVSSVRVTNSDLWANLKTGELIAEQAAPVVTDSFSYTEPGQGWVNIPWLFQVSHAALFRLVQDLVPTDPTDPTANRASAEQIAVGVLVGLGALARLLTAWLLMKIRRPGPGLWWSAICAVLAVGAILGPQGTLQTGGIANWGSVAPSTWGLLLMAGELYLLHRALNLGRRISLFVLIPLFALWVNIDDSFLLGLLILAAAAVGRLLDGKAAESLIRTPANQAEDASESELAAAPRPIAPAAGLIVLALCVVACLANPSTYRAFFAALSPWFELFTPAAGVLRANQLSFFGAGIRQQFGGEWYLLPIYFLITVAIGLGSFLINSRRFAWSRFLPFAAMAACWAIFIHLGAFFAVVFAATLSLNGQEWYHDRFGVRGRMGSMWTFWSTGGRLVTLGLVFWLVAASIAGWSRQPGAPAFGFGFDPDDFAFEAAEYLAGRDDIKGNVLNTSLAQGDALIWKASPRRKDFIDNRPNLFSRELLQQHHELRNAIRDDDVAAWKPALDKYGITAVLIETASSPNTYRRLVQSPNWIPFYDDGRIVMFGRSDAPEGDLAAFKGNRLDPELRAYKVTTPVPSPDRPPTPTTWVDEYFQNRFVSATRSHNDAAQRWLEGAASGSADASMPDPARCLLAIREARKSLARNPDDWTAYRVLNLAYQLLAAQETALLSGIELTPQNQDRILRLAPNMDILRTRFQQRVAALNYAIQTTPPPKTQEGRRELINLHLQLFQTYIQAGYVDLARDRLQMALDMAKPGDFNPEIRAQYEQQLEQLKERVKQLEDNLIDLQTERQASSVDKGLYAESQGALGMALTELEEADRGSMAPTIVKPKLIDIYCSTGQPDRALELLSSGVVDDPNLGTEPGMSYRRQGLIYLLMGNYLSASSLWKERAIPRLRYDRSLRAVTGGQLLVRGELVNASNNSLALPTMVSRQAFWEFELAQALLESGMPEEAAEHYTKALTIAPEIQIRPIAAYYLTKLGKPVPPAPVAAASTAAEPAKAESPVPVEPARPASLPKPAETAPPAAEKPKAAEPAKSAEKPKS